MFLIVETSLKKAVSFIDYQTCYGVVYAKIRRYLELGINYISHKELGIGIKTRFDIF